MKVLSALCVAPIMLIACGDDDKNTGGDATNNTNTTSDATNTGDVGPGVSPLTGVNTNVTVTTPTPNGGCDLSEVDNVNHGARYPWGGYNASSTNYTCNRCPGGHPDLQGKWRAFEYEEDNETPNYESPAADDQAETLFVDGNTWRVEYYDSLASGQKHVVARGWYFCTQQPEHPNEHLGWVITEADPNNALGFTAGNQYGSDVPLTASGEVRMFYQDSVSDENGDTGYYRSYCKFGASNNGKTCADPFE